MCAYSYLPASLPTNSTPTFNSNRLAIEKGDGATNESIHHLCYLRYVTLHVCMCVGDGIHLVCTYNSLLSFPCILFQTESLEYFVSSLALCLRFSLFHSHGQLHDVVVVDAAVHGGTRSRRLIFLGGLGPVTNDEDVQDAGG